MPFQIPHWARLGVFLLHQNRFWVVTWINWFSIWYSINKANSPRKKFDQKAYSAPASIAALALLLICLLINSSALIYLSYKHYSSYKDRFYMYYLVRIDPIYSRHIRFLSLFIFIASLIGIISLAVNSLVATSDIFLTLGQLVTVSIAVGVDAFFDAPAPVLARCSPNDMINNVYLNYAKVHFQSNWKRMTFRRSEIVAKMNPDGDGTEETAKFCPQCGVATHPGCPNCLSCGFHVVFV